MTAIFGGVLEGKEGCRGGELGKILPKTWYKGAKNAEVEAI